MTMHETAEHGYQDALREIGAGRTPNTVSALVGRLLAPYHAAYCRGYLWCLMDEGKIALIVADRILSEISQPHWKCHWFPQSWLEEPEKFPFRFRLRQARGRTWAL